MNELNTIQIRNIIDWIKKKTHKIHVIKDLSSEYVLSYNTEDN